jgi:hypothetical protein
VCRGVVDFAFENPAYGKLRVSNKLGKCGVFSSPCDMCRAGDEAGISYCQDCFQGGKGWSLQHDDVRTVSDNTNVIN